MTQEEIEQAAHEALARLASKLEAANKWLDDNGF